MRLRPAHKLFAILFFYVFLAVMVVVFSSTAGIFTYPVIIGASLLFILSFRMKVPVNGFLVGLVAAIVSMGLVLAILIALGAIRIESLKDNFLLFLILGLGLEILVGFGEELSFRAVVFHGLSDELGLVPAAALSSAGFAILHIPSMMVLGIEWQLGLIALGTIFMAGIALALLYAYGGIFNSIAFHMAWNFIEYNLLTMGPLEGAFNISKSGADILTGGAFGPEASVVTFGVVVLLVIGIWLYYVRMRKAVPMTNGA